MDIDREAKAALRQLYTGSKSGDSNRFSARVGKAVLSDYAERLAELDGK